MSNEKIKTSRASQTREKTTKKAVWTPPSSLDAPLRLQDFITGG